MIQNAYNGFAKGNFTMLDNLKLGYGGTQEEMKRLLADAEKISGIKYDISSFSDVTEAIHVMQKSMEISGYSSDELAAKLKNASLTHDEVSRVAESMGISYEEAAQKMKNGTLTINDANILLGTTAREAASTIEGSISMMKGAWENLVVGMADEAVNMDYLIDNFVESTATAAENLIPRIEQTLSGIGTLIEKMAPIIAEALPVLVETLLPTIITAAVYLITALANALVEALPAVKTALEKGLVIILTQVFGVSEEKASGFVEGLNNAFKAVADGFMAMVESAQTDGTFLNEVWTGLQETGQVFCDFLVALWDALSAAFTWCVDRINTEGTLLNTIFDNMKIRITAAIDIINGVIKAFTAVLQGDWSAAWESCKSIANTVWNAIESIISNIISYISGMLGDMVSAGYDFISSLSEGMQNMFAEIATAVSGWITDNIVDPIANMGTDLYNAGVNLLNEFWDGLESIWDSISSWWDGLSFSKKKAEVEVDTNGAKGYATGLNYVPFDNFPALLHRGEAVLTAAEAKLWRSGGYNTTPAMAGITINQYIQSVPQTAVDLANTTEAYFEQARWML